MPKMLFFTVLSLILLDCKTYAEPDYKMAGEPSSKLPVLYGEVLDKQENMITKKHIWFFKDHKAYLHDDQVSYIESYHPEQVELAMAEKENSNSENQQVPSVEVEMFNDIMKEFEEKSAEAPTTAKSKAPSLGNRPLSSLQKKR